MYKMADLRQHLKQEYKENMAVINDKEYVSIDVFEDVLYNLALSDAVIGALVVKYGNIELSDNDIMDYMTEYTNNVEVKFDKKKFTAKRV